MSKKIGNKRKNENLIRTVWQDTKKGKFINTNEQAVVIAAIVLTLSHFEEEDRLHNTVHANIFVKVYLANDPIAQGDFNSKELLSEATMEMRLDSDGYSILSTVFKSHVVTKNQKMTKKNTKERFAYEVGVGVRTLKDISDIHMKCFENKLNSINLNYTIPK